MSALGTVCIAELSDERIIKSVVLSLEALDSQFIEFVSGKNFQVVCCLPKVGLIFSEYLGVHCKISVV